MEPPAWHLVVLDITPYYFRAYHGPLGLKIHVGECEDPPAPWWAYYVRKCAPKFCVDKSVGGGVEVNTVFLGMLYCTLLLKGPSLT